jgi:hypothetical protein
LACERSVGAGPTSLPGVKVAVAELTASGVERKLFG